MENRKLKKKIKLGKHKIIGRYDDRTKTVIEQ